MAPNSSARAWKVSRASARPGPEFGAWPLVQLSVVADLGQQHLHDHHLPDRRRSPGDGQDTRPGPSRFLGERAKGDFPSAPSAGIPLMYTMPFAALARLTGNRPAWPPLIRLIVMVCP